MSKSIQAVRELIRDLDPPYDEALKELLERLESAEKVIWAVEKQAPIRRSGLINDVLDEFRQRFPKEDA